MLRISADRAREAEDLAACQALLRAGSRSFHAASLLLPKRVRARAIALYAFCRIADDLIDQNPDPEAGLAQLRARLDGVFAGRPAPHCADRALAGLVSRLRFSRAPLDALVEGFAWDAEGRLYPTLDALEAYAARVAGSVGVMMSLVMECRDPAALARAADLGIAMQLANIARDVGEDARLGRLYLPLDWLEAEGIDGQAFLANPVFSPALARVIRRLTDRARLLFERAEAGIAALPADCRPAIRAARLIYAAIADLVMRRGGDSVSARAVVSKAAKLRLALRALLPLHGERGRTSAGRQGSEAAPPLAAAMFLIEPFDVPRARQSETPGRRAQGQLLTILAIFEKLERGDRERGYSPRLDADPAR